MSIWVYTCIKKKWKKDLISHSIFFLTYILRTLTTTTEGWWHMHAVTSTSNQRPRFHVRKIQRLITFHSNTNFLSLLTSAPCPISVGTPLYIWQRLFLLLFFLSLLSSFQTQKSLTCVSIRKWLATKQGLYFITLQTHFLCIFFTFIFSSSVSFSFNQWFFWITCHLSSCFCLCWLYGFLFWLIRVIVLFNSSS